MIDWPDDGAYVDLGQRDQSGNDCNARMDDSTATAQARDAGLDNAQIAQRLREMADLLVSQQGNPYRIQAYRRAADTVARWPEPLARRFATGGVAELEAMPTVGIGISRAIAELLQRGGAWSQLDRLRGEVDPVRLFCSVPGIGNELARRIHDGLHIDTLEALEQAAHDGRLQRLPGIGGRRVASIRAALGEMLQRVRRVPRNRVAAEDEPPVATLLAVDQEYRDKAAAGKLKRIAPRRFNPGQEAWLPVMHTERDGWDLTCLFSNTARAHQAGMTHDWVVIYFDNEARREGQRTVVTETRGPLVNRRVVRGRERECRVHHALGSRKD